MQKGEEKKSEELKVFVSIWIFDFLSQNWKVKWAADGM